MQSDPGAEATHVQATPNCTLPYHWPRLDKEQILCLRIVNVPGCLWSGGFKVTNNAFHINVRYVIVGLFSSFIVLRKVKLVKLSFSEIKKIECILCGLKSFFKKLLIL